MPVAYVATVAVQTGTRYSARQTGESNALVARREQLAEEGQIARS